MNKLQKLQRGVMHGLLAACLLGVVQTAIPAGNLRVQNNNVGAQNNKEPGPPFWVGEVAVYATPQELPGRQLIRFHPYSGISVISVEPGREMAEAQKLRAKGRRAGPNYIAQAFAVPSDPFYFPYQWHLSHIQSESAWDVTAGDAVTVAVLDTGFRPGGQDGINCILDEIDIVNNDFVAWDGDGHGTHVSGTVSQNTDNTGVAGMAHDACVMPVKILDDNGSGSFADIAEGVHYAVDNGARVINMSLGIAAHWGWTYDSVLGPALDYAFQNDVTVVCAAGNDGSRNNVSYPASHPTTIAVGATDFNNQITGYSNRGDGLDIMAPGGNTSTDANGDGYVDGVLQETNLGSGWAYYFLQGTSMASPHVAGVAAMIIARGSATTPDDVYEALTATALDLGDSGFDATYGHGLVQAYDAIMHEIGSGGDPTPAPTPAPTPTPTPTPDADTNANANTNANTNAVNVTDTDTDADTELCANTQERKRTALL